MKLLPKVLVLLLVVLLLIPSINVLAIADPDSNPQIRAVHVYEDLLETGDVGVLVDYYIDYAVIPDEPVSESYLVSFIDTDGITQLNTVAPYPFAYSTFVDYGYNRGMAWIYFTEAEATTAGLDSANSDDYSIWLMGNPTVASGWVGDPPKVTGGIDYWYTSGDSSILVAQRVLTLGGQYEIVWSVDLVEATTLGTRLTSIGEDYFVNAINGLRAIAPACFPIASYPQIQEDIDYSTTFDVTIEDGTGTLPVSPLDLVAGSQDVTITGAGTFILTLSQGVYGTASSKVGGCTVAGSPVTLVAGENTITSNLAGTNDFTVNVNIINTSTQLQDTITGTGFDLSVLADRFGLSTMLFSGIVWLGITIACCLVFVRISKTQFGQYSHSGIMFIVEVCAIGGIVLGLLDIMIGILIFLGFGFLIIYQIFWKGASV